MTTRPKDIVEWRQRLGETFPTLSEWTAFRQYPCLFGRSYNEREVCETPEHRLHEYKKALRVMDVPVLRPFLDEMPTLCLVRFFLIGSSLEGYAAAWDGMDTCWGLGVISSREQGRTAEWGFFSLAEMSQRTGRYSLGVEVDVAFQPTDGWSLR